MQNINIDHKNVSTVKDIRLLAGIRVMVTRPEHQAQPFCDMLTQQGAQIIRLPLIEIEATPVDENTRSILTQIEQIDYAVFISPNAVAHGLAELQKHSPLPDNLKLVTIGKASAQKMQQILGREADIYPTEQYNSEALLALDSMQSSQVNNKNIIIFRGQGGRELLAESLRHRGARVHYAEVYRRICPAPQDDLLDSIWKDGTIPDIITLSSNEALNNLLVIHKQFASKKSKQFVQQLYQTSLVVVTEKMRSNARQQGFEKHILIAAKASNEALLESVLEWTKIKRQAQ